MFSFYHFMKSFRGEIQVTEEGRLAEWIFSDFDFPKQSADYNEISDYLEWNSPFPEAATVFDYLWSLYMERR